MDPALEFEQLMLSEREPILKAITQGDSPIQKFYNGSKIFITGGYGFIGKLIVEKMFRACNISTIYVLMRTKKNLKPQERLVEFLNEPVFSILHKEKPEFVNKIVPIEGDISKPNIGINDEDWNTLVQEVDIIFHLAANIRFDVGVKEAVLANVCGTRETLRLGKCCKNLRAFVHVSTAFTHATQSREGCWISESFHESPGQPEAVIHIAETADDDKLKGISKLIVGDWPNTYTMSKALADEVIRKMAGDLPMCIVKPAIVISTYCEPVPGWLDMSCVYGPTGFLLGLGLGVIHATLSDVKKRLDIVPADMVANAIIASAWGTAKKKELKEPMIYTVTNSRNPMTWGFQSHTVRNTGSNYVTPKVIWYPFSIETKRKFIFLVLMWILHYIPAYIIDGVCFLLRKPQRLVKLYKKMHKLHDLFSYFTQREWLFQDSNLQQLYRDMSNTDRIIFNFNIDTIKMKHLITVWCIGIRKYIVKDGLQGTEYAKKKMFWLEILHYITLAVYAFCLWKSLEILFCLTTIFCNNLLYTLLN